MSERFRFSIPCRITWFHLLVATLLSTLLPLAAAAKDPGAAAVPVVELYVSEVSDGQTFAALDPATLDDQPEQPVLELGGAVLGGAVLSADGSTLAFVTADGRIVVRDGLAGPERLRFDPEVYVDTMVPEALTLSRDGTRLVVRVDHDLSDVALQPPAWKVFDTASGRLLASVQGDPGEVQTRIDADARRLYRLVVPGVDPSDELPTAPGLATIVAHDLTTGSEVGRLELPDVRAGYWQRERTLESDGDPALVMADLVPALAVAPDGRRLAVVHADEDAVTLVAAERLTVERTLALEGPDGWWERLAAALPLAPQPAQAKVAEGAWLRAVFAADGRHLYVVGEEGSLENGEPVFRGLGLRVLDIEQGEIVAEALGDARVDQVMPAPDGHGVFAFGPATAAASGFVDGAEPPYWLRRFDPLTLETLAEREFPVPGYRWFLLRPAGTEFATSG